MFPLPAGSGRFIYDFTATGIEQVVVPAGTYKAIRVDVTAKGYVDPSHDFSPIFVGNGCHRSSDQGNKVDINLSLDFRGTIW